MSNPLEHIDNVVSTTAQAADELLESGEERQQQLTDRHEMDMINGSWLTKNIRPLTLIGLLFYWLVLMPVMLTFDISIPAEVTKAVEYLSMAAFSFYFGSRGFEKIQTMRTRAEIRRERRESRRKK